MTELADSLAKHSFFALGGRDTAVTTQRGDPSVMRLVCVRRHDLARPLRELRLRSLAELVERGPVLDNSYLPAGVPMAYPEGAPFEHNDPRQSEEAIEDASPIVEYCCATQAATSSTRRTTGLVMK